MQSRNLRESKVDTIIALDGEKPIGILDIQDVGVGWRRQDSPINSALQAVDLSLPSRN